MVVLDETSSQKAFPNVTLVRPVPMPNLPPPPAYFTSQEQANGFLPPFSGQLHRQGKRAVPLKLSTLPAHILLLIVYMTFPQTDGIDESRVVRQRKILFWLEYYARLTDRSLYVGESVLLVAVTAAVAERPILNSMHACPTLHLSPSL